MRMTSREIAELAGSRHDKVKQSIERLATEKENKPAVICLPPLGEYLDSLGRPASEYIFSGEQGKRDSIVVVAQLSPEFTARLVDRWQELESQQVKQPTPQITSSLEDDLRGISFIADNLRISDSGKLGMLTKYCQANAQRLLPALPAYAIDAPVIAGTASSASSEETAPITKIVAGITSAAKANQALHRAGLLEQKTRMSRSGEEKRYWCVTEAGLKYGKNVTHPNSPLETQPHWYVSKADEIVAIVRGSNQV